MSSTEIFGFDREGYAAKSASVQNAWRGAMCVWRILEERYLQPYIPNYVHSCNWYYPGISAAEVERCLGYKPSRLMPSFGGDDPMMAIWKLQHNRDVSERDRIVLLTTLDKVLVRKENVPRVIDAFRAFEGETNLGKQADILQTFYDDPEIIAVGWNQTSVNYDTWMRTGDYNEETDEHSPYNCLTGENHWWLFDELDRLLEESEEEK